MKDAAISLPSSPAIWWAGQRAMDSLGLQGWYSIEQIISCDDGAESDALAAATGARIFSLERVTQKREPWSNYDVARAVEAYALTMRENADLGAVAFVPYRSDSRIESFTKRFGMRYIGPPASVVEQLDDKIFAYFLLHGHGLARCRARPMLMDAVPWKDVVQEFGCPAVIRRRRSASGSGCRIVSTSAEWNDAQLWSDGHIMLVSEYTEGTVLNVHGLVERDRVSVSFPSVELCGIPGCAVRREVYCGNDYGAARHLGSATVSRVNAVIERIGEVLRDEGYAGIFGVDVVVGPDFVEPIDLNPRWQGSTWLLMQLELAAGRVPIAVRHIQSFLTEYEAPCGIIENQRESELGPGAQLIMHAPSICSMRICSAPKPGVYGVDGGGKIEFRRNGLSIVDLRRDSEALLSCGIVPIGRVVARGAALGRVFFREVIVDARTGALMPFANEMLEWLADQYEYCPMPSEREE